MEYFFNDLRKDFLKNLEEYSKGKYIEQMKTMIKKFNKIKPKNEKTSNIDIIIKKIKKPKID